AWRWPGGTSPIAWGWCAAPNSARPERLAATLLFVQLEQADGVVTPDLAPLRVIDDLGVVVPVGRVLHVLEGVVGAEVDLVVVEHVERAAEGRVVEVATRGDMKVLPEIVTEGPLAAIAAR